MAPEMHEVVTSCVVPMLLYARTGQSNDIHQVTSTPIRTLVLYDERDRIKVAVDSQTGH